MLVEPGSMGPDVQLPTAKSRRSPLDGCDVTTAWARSAIHRTEAEGTPLS